MTIEHDIQDIISTVYQMQQLNPHFDNLVRGELLEAAKLALDIGDTGHARKIMNLTVEKQFGIDTSNTDNVVEYLVHHNDLDLLKLYVKMFNNSPTFSLFGAMSTALGIGNVEAMKILGKANATLYTDDTVVKAMSKFKENLDGFEFAYSQQKLNLSLLPHIRSTKLLNWWIPKRRPQQ